MAKQQVKKTAVRKSATVKAVKKSARKTAVTRSAAKKVTRSKTTTAPTRSAARKVVKKAARPAGGVTEPVITKRSARKTVRQKQVSQKMAPKELVSKKQAQKKAAITAPVKRTVRKIAQRSTAPSRDVERALERPTTLSWPDAVDAGHDIHVHFGIDQHGPDPRAQLHAVQGSPNELHPGTTRKTGKSHDRPGSQLERKRHQYPSSNVPNKGSAHTAQAKGKRRNEQPSGE